MPVMPTVKPVVGPDVDAAYDAAQCVVETHRRLSGYLHEGLTLGEIDVFVAETLDDLGCKSCFLKYKVPRVPPFPSHACLSLNECVVHGTATYTRDKIKSGDLLSIDIGVWRKKWVGDAAWTYMIGEVSDENRRLCECGKESLRRGIEQLRPGNTYIEWARAVQGHVEDECGFHLVRGLGGHGYGKKLHAPPFVSNVVPLYPGEWPDAQTECQPGTLIAVEPMISVGTPQTIQERKLWPVYTADNSMSVHYEHDVLITEDGPRVLTEGLDEIKDVID